MLQFYIYFVYIMSQRMCTIEMTNKSLTERKIMDDNDESYMD